MPNTNYPAWTQTYSNEDFDRIQALAFELTTTGPGYSKEAIEEATRIVRAAKRVSK